MPTIPIPENFKNKAYVLHGIDDARLEPHPLPPAPGPKEVLLRSLSTGICGTDLHYLKEMGCGEIKITYDLVMGHEASAQVVAVGSEVKNFKPGDRVCYEPSVSCLECEPCGRLEYNLCDSARKVVPIYTGSLTYYFNHSALFTFKIPDNLSSEEAAMIEPLTVAVYAAQKGKLTFGDKLLITGSGPIGLLILQVAKAYGATRVVITDINKDRLKIAKDLGAETIQVEKSWSEEKTLQEIKKSFGGNLPNKTFECSGVASNFRLVLLACKTSGTAVFIGMGPDEINLPIADAANREITIKSCFRYRGCFPLAIELAASGKLQLSKLITHRFAFEDCDKAFDVAAKGQGIKVIIKVGEDTGHQIPC